uniref:Uncharacterized protein LOC104219298 n=1 Tax=Nicotiana sylvestris TaxID=4096 RepID=A0A1U7W0U2_NICSY|nr:PREDICTED: uncharacterized protein LOC104219298 [Nicotiana sylvestris]
MAHSGIKYPDWLANVVVVPKKGNKLRMYVDYKDLNKETFDILKKNNTKLNPEKCAFGGRLVKFLGFMVSNQEIEINHDKIKAIEDITVVDNVKVIQRLIGRMTALGWIISRSSDKSHWFFSLLKKKKNNLSWTPECHQSVEELKCETEYEAMIAGLELAKSLGDEVIEAKCDSFLVVNQVAGTFKVKEEQMRRIESFEYEGYQIYLVRKDIVQKNIRRPAIHILGAGRYQIGLERSSRKHLRESFGSQSFVRKLIRAGYYWTEMEKDAKDFVRKM